MARPAGASGINARRCAQVIMLIPMQKIKQVIDVAKIKFILHRYFFQLNLCALQLRKNTPAKVFIAKLQIAASNIL
jgi:hypothetical protein